MKTGDEYDSRKTKSSSASTTADQTDDSSRQGNSKGGRPMTARAVSFPGPGLVALALLFAEVVLDICDGVARCELRG
ncbi:MAG: hypothetical protein JWO19_1501 [Bryobacterales bacterium]|nr:hypothetical protein [Bryobacterales bacterium]